VANLLHFILQKISIQCKWKNIYFYFGIKNSNYQSTVYILFCLCKLQNDCFL